METFLNYYAGIILTISFAAFFAKNITTAKHTRLAIKGNSKKVNIMIIITTVGYTITYISIFFTPAYFFEVGILDILFLKVTGTIIITVALIIALAALKTMKDSWRVGIREEQKTELISKGVFRFSRNPYFLSNILMFFGIFMIIPTYIFMLFYILCVVLIHLMILDEESYLVKQHGESYISYKNSVRRYL